MIGTIIITRHDVEGIIIDKVVRSTNGASTTVYLLMLSNGSVKQVDYDEIKQVVKFKEQCVEQEYLKQDVLA